MKALQHSPLKLLIPWLWLCIWKEQISKWRHLSYHQVIFTFSLIIIIGRRNLVLFFFSVLYASTQVRAWYKVSPSKYLINESLLTNHFVFQHQTKEAYIQQVFIKYFWENNLNINFELGYNINGERCPQHRVQLHEFSQYELICVTNP